MVSKFISGKSIGGALRYNENKVSEDKAKCILAEGYGKQLSLLSVSDKLARLENLASLNEKTSVNCVHISLNFDPSEVLSDEKLTDIAQAYMDKIGFGEQPYLVYRHYDAAHSHLHIVSTNVQSNGKRISLHNIGRNQSETARKEIEKEFKLIPAEGREKIQTDQLKSTPEVAVYGKSETKRVISNIVRSVIKDYKYTSLTELNALLRQFNVVAYRGEEGSKMFEKKGLVYSIVDKNGNKTGVPIKASSIYSKPTLVNLEKHFEKNIEKRAPYKQRLKNIITKALNTQAFTSKEDFAAALLKQNVVTLFRENEKMVYGVTFIDKEARTIFNGSSLGKEFSAAGILKQFGIEGLKNQQEKKDNEQLLQDSWKAIDTTKGAASSLAQLYDKGLRVHAERNEDGNMIYRWGSSKTHETNYVLLDKKYSAYFQVNGLTKRAALQINKKADSLFANPSQHLKEAVMRFASYISNILASEKELSHANHKTMDQKKRRRPNW